MKQDIILIGGGGHCKSIIDVIEQEGKYNVKGILDLPENKGMSVLGYPIIGCDDDIPELAKSKLNFIISLGQIGDFSKRKNIFKKLTDLKIKLPIIIAPLAYVSKHASIGQGTVIMNFAIVNAGASIGNNCIINNRALIEHDVLIGDHTHISTGAIVNGGVRIGAGSFFGSGAVSKEYVELPENSFVKANSIVK